MTKRERFFENLKKVLNYLLSNDFAGFSILVAFIIVFGILGFMLFKQEPIPLTENEVEYYTSQAETAYLKGLYYLDNNMEFVPINETQFNVYSSTQPEEKQKLRVTFSDNIISSKEFYYSINFISVKILRTISGALIGIILWLLLLFLMEYINSRI